MLWCYGACHGLPRAISKPALGPTTLLSPCRACDVVPRGPVRPWRTEELTYCALKLRLDSHLSDWLTRVAKRYPPFASSSSSSIVTCVYAPNVSRVGGLWLVMDRFCRLSGNIRSVFICGLPQRSVISSMIVNTSVGGCLGPASP